MAAHKLLASREVYSNAEIRNTMFVANVVTAVLVLVIIITLAMSGDIEVSP